MYIRDTVSKMESTLSLSLVFNEFPTETFPAIAMN